MKLQTSPFSNIDVITSVLEYTTLKPKDYFIFFNIPKNWFEINLLTCILSLRLLRCANHLQFSQSGHVESTIHLCGIH